jgi:hypothetical protein
MGAYAQIPGAPSPEPEALPGSSPPPLDAAPAETDTPDDTSGDVITLKNGREIRGFKVIGQTTMEVVLLLSDGIELRLPRKMVASIQINEQRGTDLAGDGAEDALTRELKGVRLAPVLSRRLQQPVASDGPREIRNADFITEIVTISQHAEVPLLVTDAVRAVPVQQRQWTTEIAPDSSFFSILHDDLLSKFPLLAVEYRFDEVVLTTHEAMEAEAREEETEESAPAALETGPAEAATPPLPE